MGLNVGLGYEQVYQDRLNETKSMITLATLLDTLDQGVGKDGDIDYRTAMQEAREVAEKASECGLPTQNPDVSLVTSVICSNVKIMVYNIVEYTIRNLLQAIYDRLREEQCGYSDVSLKLRDIWHHTWIHKGLVDPSAKNDTVEHISKKLLDCAIDNATLDLKPNETIGGGNLDGDTIFKLFERHGVHTEHANGECQGELMDVKNRRNALAHGSISFAEAGSQVTTPELAQLVNHVDAYLSELRKDVISYLDAGGYRSSSTDGR